MLDVYCDNEDLAGYIMDAEPSECGLYAHEQAIIMYSTLGKLSTPNGFITPGFCSYKFGVDYPELLIQSLIDRGYMTITDKSNFFNYVSTKSVQQFLKERGLKSGISRIQVVTRLEEYGLLEEYRKYYGNEFIVPTEKGYEAIKGWNYEKIYEGWEAHKENVGARKVKRRDIKIVEPTDEYNLKYENGQLLIEGNGFVSKTRCHSFHRPSKISFYINNVHICSADNVISVLWLIGRKELLIDRFVANSYVYECYDLLSGKLLFNENVSMPRDEYERKMTIDMSAFRIKSNGIYHKNKIKYFLSCDNERTEILLREIYDKNGIIELNKIDIPGAKTYDNNLVISVDKDNEEMRNYIMFLAYLGKLRMPTIAGTEIITLIRGLYFKDKCKCMAARECKLEFSRIGREESYAEDRLDGLEYSDVVSKLRAILPDKVIFSCASEYSADESGFDYNWVNAKNNFEKYRIKYESDIFKLKELGVIPSHWISEFNLYLLVKKYYPDVVYQYRADWLGLQSLDIYIPSIKMGIEYQGKQHYEPIDIFGGEVGFKATTERDLIKAEKCRLNDVKLLYWKYDIKITEEEVKKQLNL